MGERGVRESCTTTGEEPCAQNGSFEVDSLRKALAWSVRLWDDHPNQLQTKAPNQSGKQWRILHCSHHSTPNRLSHKGLRHAKSRKITYSSMHPFYMALKTSKVLHVNTTCTIVQIVATLHKTQFQRLHAYGHHVKDLFSIIYSR